jgi:hypothetical protein
MSTGYCRLCGKLRKLTEEHVPPRNSGNVTTVKSYRDQLLVNLDSNTKPFLRAGGVSFKTLCEKCNSFLGHNYVTEFSSFSKSSGNFLSQVSGSDFSNVLRIRPACIMKQIISMFIAINPVTWSDLNQELRDYVLNVDFTRIPEAYKIYAYYNNTNIIRYDRFLGIQNISTNMLYTFSNITYPPLGFMLTDNSQPKFANITDVTYFTRYRFTDIIDYVVNFATLNINLGMQPEPYEIIYTNLGETLHGEL